MHENNRGVTFFSEREGTVGHARIFRLANTPVSEARVGAIRPSKERRLVLFEFTVFEHFLVCVSLEFAKIFVVQLVESVPQRSSVADAQGLKHQQNIE